MGLSEYLNLVWVLSGGILLIRTIFAQGDYLLQVAIDRSSIFLSQEGGAWVTVFLMVFPE